MTQYDAAVPSDSRRSLTDPLLAGVVVFAVAALGVAWTARDVTPVHDDDFNVWAQAACTAQHLSVDPLGAATRCARVGPYPPLVPFVAGVWMWLRGAHGVSVALESFAPWYAVLAAAAGWGARPHGRLAAASAAVLAPALWLLGDLRHSFYTELAMAACAMTVCAALARSDGLRRTGPAVVAGLALGAGCLVKWTFPLFVALPVAASCLLAPASPRAHVRAVSHLAAAMVGGVACASVLSPEGGVPIAVLGGGGAALAAAALSGREAGGIRAALASATSSLASGVAGALVAFAAVRVSVAFAVGIALLGIGGAWWMARRAAGPPVAVAGDEGRRGSAVIPFLAAAVLVAAPWYLRQGAALSRFLASNLAGSTYDGDRMTMAVTLPFYPSTTYADLGAVPLLMAVAGLVVALLRREPFALLCALGALGGWLGLWAAPFRTARYLTPAYPLLAPALLLLGARARALPAWRALVGAWALAIQVVWLQPPRALPDWAGTWDPGDRIEPRGNQRRDMDEAWARLRGTHTRLRVAGVVPSRAGPDWSALAAALRDLSGGRPFVATTLSPSTPAHLALIEALAAAGVRDDTYVTDGVEPRGAEAVRSALADVGGDPGRPPANVYVVETLPEIWFGRQLRVPARAELYAQAGLERVAEVPYVGRSDLRVTVWRAKDASSPTNPACFDGTVARRVYATDSEAARRCGPRR